MITNTKKAFIALTAAINPVLHVIILYKRNYILHMPYNLCMQNTGIEICACCTYYESNLFFSPLCKAFYFQLNVITANNKTCTQRY